MAKSRVTAWKRLEGFPVLSEGTLAELLDGGQAFRWKLQPDGSWQGIWANHCVGLIARPDGLYWRTFVAEEVSALAALRDYLDAGQIQAKELEALPWRSDSHLERSIAAFPGLRILKQPLGETLLCFLCSATKQIVQIKQMVALLASRHGTKLENGDHCLPTWPELALVSESQLRSCLLGFRARYIHLTAQFLQAHPGWLEQTGAAPYEEAKTRLCLLPGVGEKVADCVLLFGAGRREAFPVDTWMIKTMALRYQLEGWRPAQIAHFGRVHFGSAAGLAQQYLFAWERREARKVRLSK